MLIVDWSIIIHTVAVEIAVPIFRVCALLVQCFVNFPIKLRTPLGVETTGVLVWKIYVQLVSVLR